MNNIYRKLSGVLVLVLLTACGEADNQGNIASDSQKIPQLSVQLWSVKDAVKEDFNGTLQRLAGMGFDGVEFAGEFGDFAQDPQGLKQFLESLGLQASGAHVGFDLLTEQKLPDTLAFYQALGVELIIVPWDERAWHPDGVKEVARELTALSEQVKTRGMRIGFHNHDKEFDSYQDSTYWDYLAQNTPESVFLQLDVGWVNFAGKDPIEYVTRYPGRTLTTHYKVVPHEGSGQSPIIGKDGYQWQSLLQANIAHGGTLWIVVEQETYPEGLSPLDSVQKSKSGVDSFIQAIR